jgi:DNA-binding response OmpR family regulator
METLIRLRTDEHTSSVPVIAMCGLGQYGAELGLWAKAIVVKAFRPAQLLIKLQNAIRARNVAMYTDSTASRRFPLSRHSRTLFELCVEEIASLLTVSAKVEVKRLSLTN